jgi:hypothetical protein
MVSICSRSCAGLYPALLWCSAFLRCVVANGEVLSRQTSGPTYDHHCSRSWGRDLWSSALAGASTKGRALGAFDPNDADFDRRDTYNIGRDCTLTNLHGRALSKVLEV